MSFDLYPEETARHLASLKPVQTLSAESHMSEFIRQFGPIIMFVIGLYAGERAGNFITKKTGSKIAGWGVGILVFLIVGLGGAAFF